MLLSILFSLMPFYFEAETGNGGGSGDGDTSTGGGDGQSGPDGGATGGTGGDGDSSGERKFTQADMDQLAGKTRQQALDRKARDLGFDKWSDVESVVNAKIQADEAAKSELEQVQGKLNKANARADANEQLAFRILLRSAFDRAAGGQVDDLDLAYLAANDLKLLTSEAGIKVDLEGLKVEGVDKAVKTLLEQKPILKKSTGASPPSTGGGEGGTPPPPLEIDEKKKAEYQRRFGVGT